jgi:hypothetical protein
MSSEFDETDRSSDSGDSSVIENVTADHTPLTSVASLGHGEDFTVVLLENPKDIAAIRYGSPVTWRSCL